MEKQIIKCTSCGNEFDGKYSHTNLGFKKYECPECKQNFITELTTGYKIFYGLLLLVLVGTGISSIVDGGFPLVRLIFSVLICLLFYKDYSIKKNGGQNTKKTGKTGFIVVGVIAVLIALSFIMQGDPVKFNEEQKKYIGNWQGNGIKLVIRDDSYINYQKQKESVSTSVSGPIVEMNENDFKVGIGFIKSKFVIDKKPYQDGNLWKMTVDGNELSRVTNSYELKIPEVGELNKLTNDFFTLFNNSIYKDDYQTFYDGISKTWQSQTNTDELKKLLASATKNKIDLEKIIINEIVYSKPPFLDQNNLLVLEGYYTGEVKLSFSLKFIYEYPNWKLVGFNF
ncbi:hypothetical protein EOM39_04215 [Candidatus Gracilibacteria bacterium]|nr:hypothetical protein [Candidatus Gracilibacteria bacterium]